MLAFCMEQNRFQEMPDCTNGSLTVRELRVVDAEGRLRVRVGDNGSEGFGFTLHDIEGRPRVEIEDGSKVCRISLVGKEKSRILLSLVKDTEGQIVGVSEAPWMVVTDEFSEGHICLTSGMLGPAFYMFGEDQHLMAKIDGVSTNMPSVAVCDRKGVERVMLAENLGHAFVGVADEDGMIDTELSRENGLMLPDDE